MDALDSDSSFRRVADRFIDDWDPALAKKAFQEILDANDNQVDGVLATNDGLAGAVLQVRAERNLTCKVQVTGQNATLIGLRAVLRGDQCMTAYKPIRDEAEAAARLAAELAEGDFAGADDLTTGNSRDPANRHDVKAMLIGVRPVTLKNIRDMVTQLVLKAADLCKGLAEACARADVPV